jgi:DNA polymerase III epsilon subunit-like protein
MRLLYPLSMKLPPFSFAVLDTETTGFVPRVHRVIEYAAVRVEGGEVVDTAEYLFSIPGEIPPLIQTLTHIKPEMLQGQPDFATMHEEIAKKLEGVDLLVGQNLSFDIGMLKGEGLDLSERAWIDTSMLASLAFPELPSFSLPYMSRVLGLTHEPAHRALGDVRATLELLARVWERLCELDAEQTAFAQKIMGGSVGGYRILFNALEGKGKGATWISQRQRKDESRSGKSVPLAAPPVGTVALREETLDAGCLQGVVDAAADDTTTVRWIAVKNLEGSLKRLTVPDHVTVLHPPQLLLNPEAAETLAKQETFTSDEAFIRLKLAWWNPRTRNDVALHGGEKDVWNGKLACTDTTPVYTSQFDQKSHAFLLDHRQLLQIVHDAETAKRLDGAHVIIDDASMLEDTATKAFGHFLGMDYLRAAATGDEQLLRISDLLSLFCEKIRGGEDQYMVTPADLRKPEAAALRSDIDTMLTLPALPPKTEELLRGARALLEENLPEQQIVWIERRMDGALMLQSAPKRVDTLLKDVLYDRHPTTLLVPSGADGHLPEIVSPETPVLTETSDGFAACDLPVHFPSDKGLLHILQNPPPGKTIILAGSKRTIEQSYTVHAERLDAAGVTMICQGMSGGQGRMEAEFVAADSPAILMVTPFMYEGLDFPEGMADRLIIETVPFDHPNHPVLALRRNHYKNAFSEYNVPRLQFRLFRLLRSFCRHKRDGADVTVLDKRLHEKDYGKGIMHYLKLCGGSADTDVIEKPTQLKMPL